MRTIAEQNNFNSTPQIGLQGLEADLTAIQHTENLTWLTWTQFCKGEWWTCQKLITKPQPQIGLVCIIILHLNFSNARRCGSLFRLNEMGKQDMGCIRVNSFEEVPMTFVHITTHHWCKWPNGVRTIRRGQFSADNSAQQFVADNSAQTIILILWKIQLSFSGIFSSIQQILKYCTKPPFQQ